MKAYSESHSVEVEKVRSSLTEAVTYMTHFRADNIVKDAEAIKNALLLQLEDEDDEVNWTHTLKCYQNDHISNLFLTLLAIFRVRMSQRQGLGVLHWASLLEVFA